MSDTMADLFWGFWINYPKAWHNGKEYAVIGNRFYTKHAVTCFLPSGRRTIAGFPRADQEGGGYAFDPKARSLSPENMEYVIVHGSKRLTVENGEPRTVHSSGDVEVVTTRDEKIVITARYSHEK
jgi:hypothetical protein